MLFRSGGFGAPLVEKLQNPRELVLNPGGEVGPLPLVYSGLHLCWMKVLLNINGQGVEHETPTLSLRPALLEEENSDGVENRNQPKNRSVRAPLQHHLLQACSIAPPWPLNK